MLERRNHESAIPMEIYTDGSLKKMGATMTFGGWGYIVVKNGQRIYEASGAEYGTTNQRMELFAIKQALEYAKENRYTNEPVVIYSDSAYAINCYQQDWYINWQNNGWMNSNKQRVANQDLWMDIIPYFDNFWYHFVKVKGHGNNFWNNKCDQLAQDASEHMKISWRGQTNE